MDRRSAALTLTLALVPLVGCDEPGEGCRTVTDCCLVCHEGVPCGDECLPTGETCHRVGGCACSVADLCQGGGVSGRGSLAYRSCVGPRGGCGEHCCVETNDHGHLHEAQVSCAVHSAGEGSYRLSFSITDPEGESGFVGEDLVFGDDRRALSPVESCESFSVREALNEHPALGCTGLDARPDGTGGGGCSLGLRLDGAGIVDGEVTCEELQLPSQSLFLSTVSEGAVGPGTFSLYGCDLRL